MRDVHIVKANPEKAAAAGITDPVTEHPNYEEARARQKELAEKHVSSQMYHEFWQLMTWPVCWDPGRPEWNGIIHQGKNVLTDDESVLEDA